MPFSTFIPTNSSPPSSPRPPPPSFVAFGRARGAQASLRARSSGVAGSAGTASVTPRRPRTPLPHAATAAPLRLGGGGGGGASVSARRGAAAATPPAAAVACARADWFAAAACGDVLGLVRAVRGGFTEIGAGERGSGRSAMMAGAELGREDVCACVFELARGVGGVEVMYGHRDGMAREVCEGKDRRGRNALHYAAMCELGEDGVAEEGDLVRTVRRLAGYGVPISGVDQDGATPEALARKLGNYVAESALKEASRRLGG